MSLFDSIIGEVNEKFNLSGEKAGGLLSALLGLMTAPGGGFRGFIDRFTNAGLGDTATSWITMGDNTPLSDEQLESALGEDTIGSVAQQAGVDRATATSAMAFMVPQVVDRLTPDGEVPNETDLLSRIGGFLTGAGGAIAGGLGTAGAAAGGAFDRVGSAAEELLDRDRDVVVDRTDTVRDSSGVLVGDRAGMVNTTRETIDDDTDDGGSILRWLLPLLLLGLLLVLGYWFCSRPSTPIPPGNANVNRANVNANANTAARAVDSSFRIEAKDGRYVVSGAVPDEATRKQIADALTAQYGAGNVDLTGLQVNSSARPFATGWWDNFSKMLPSLKDWKTGTLSFVGNSIDTASGLPQAAIDQLKSLFGTGWRLPVSIAGAETATKQANEEALKNLGQADSVEEVVGALNASIINFASGKSDIPADAKPIIDKAAEVLKKQPAGTSVEIGGYTDNQGNSAANKTLSQARADSVKKALVGLGVGDAMLKSVGYGDASPVGDNSTEDGRFRNRRIEYKTGSGSSPTATTTNTTTNTTNTNSAANANSAK